MLTIVQGEADGRLVRIQSIGIYRESDESSAITPVPADRDIRVWARHQGSRIVDGSQLCGRA